MGGTKSKEEGKDKDQKGSQEQKPKEQKETKRQEELKKQQKLDQQQQDKQINEKNGQKVQSVPPPQQPLQTSQQTQQPIFNEVQQIQNKPEFNQPQQKHLEQSVFISAIQYKQTDIAAKKGDSQIYQSVYKPDNPNQSSKIIQQSTIKTQNSQIITQGNQNKIMETQAQFQEQRNSIITNKQQSQIIQQSKIYQSQIGNKSEISQNQKTEHENIMETSRIIEQVQIQTLFNNEQPNQNVKIQKVVYDLLDLFIKEIIQVETYKQVFEQEQAVYSQQLLKMKLFIKYNQTIFQQLELFKPQNQIIVHMVDSLMNEFVTKVDFIELTESKPYVQMLIDVYKGKKLDLEFQFVGDNSEIQLAYDEELDLGREIESIVEQNFQIQNFKYKYSDLMEGKLQYLQFCRRKIRSKRDQYKFQEFQNALQFCDLNLRILFFKVYQSYQSNQSEEINGVVALLNPIQTNQLMDVIFTLEKYNITALYDFIQIMRNHLDINHKKFRQEQLDVFMNMLQ